MVFSLFQHYFQLGEIATLPFLLIHKSKAYVIGKVTPTLIPLRSPSLIIGNVILIIVGCIIYDIW